MKPTIAFVSGFVLGVMTPVIVFLAVALLFPGERRQYRLTSDMVLEDVAEFGDFAKENQESSGATSVMRKGRTLFVNAKKGTVNYISFETSVTDETLAAYSEPVIVGIQNPAEVGE